VANPSIRSIQKDGNWHRLNRDPDSWFVKTCRKFSFVNNAGEFPNADKSLNLPSLPISAELCSVKMAAKVRPLQGPRRYQRNLLLFDAINLVAITGQRY